MAIVTSVPQTRYPSVDYQQAVVPRRLGDQPGDIVGISGRASRGLLDTPYWAGSPDEFRRQLGAITVDPGNPTTALGLYLTYRAVRDQGARDVVLVRTGDARASAGLIHLKTSTNKVLALQAATPGTWANGQLSAAVTQNVDGTTFNLTVTLPTTGETATLIRLSASDVNALALAINASTVMQPLVFASFPVIDAPAILALTPSSSGGTLLSGTTYYGLLTWLNAAGGETTGGVESTATIVTGPTGSIAFTVPALPTDAASWRFYGGLTQGDETLQLSGSSAGAQTWTTPLSGGVRPPARNTAINSTAATTRPDAATTIFPSTIATGQWRGHDGHQATTARIMGQDGSNAQGIYTFAGLDQKPNFVLLEEAAAADTTLWSAQATLAQQNLWTALVCLPQATSDLAAAGSTSGLTQAAVVALAALPSADYLKVGYPWIKRQENELFKTQLTVAPTGYFAGISAVQDPNTSGAVKPLNGLADLEYRLAQTRIELPLAGINLNVATADIPLAGVGFATDLMLSGLNGYEARMRLLLARNFRKRAAKYLALPNTQTLRSQAQADMQAFLDGLARAGLIPPNPDAGLLPVTQAGAAAAKPVGTQPSTTTVAPTTINYVVVCDDSNNLFNGVPTSILYMDVICRLFPNVEHVLFRVELGTDVQVTLGLTA